MKKIIISILIGLTCASMGFARQTSGPGSISGYGIVADCYMDVANTAGISNRFFFRLDNGSRFFIYVNGEQGLSNANAAVSMIINAMNN